MGRDCILVWICTGVDKEFSSWGAFKLRGAVASAAACELRVVDIGHVWERESESVLASLPVSLGVSCAFYS